MGPSNFNWESAPDPAVSWGGLPRPILSTPFVPPFETSNRPWR